jgi:hypothetical protein
MKLTHRPDLETRYYAELWATEPFDILPWWQRGVRLPAERKGDERRIGCQFKFDLGAPGWAIWEGTSQPGPWEGLPEARVVILVAAANEAMLDRDPPAPGALPIRRGVNVLAWDEEGASPFPTPAPSPVPDAAAHRVLVVAEIGHPSLIVRPSESGERLSLIVTQRPTAWFDRLAQLIGEEN